VKRAAILGVFAAVMATAWTFLVAQQGQSQNFKEPKPALSPTFGAEPPGPPVAGPATPAKTPQFIRADLGPVEAPPTPLSPLQQRFIELSTRKARSLKEEQLQKLVNDLNEEVEGLNAWTRVEEGARVLRDVADKSPQTPAGRAAKAALRIIEQFRSSNELVPDPEHGAVRGFDRRNLEPQSDPQFTPGPPIDKTQEHPFDTPSTSPPKV
jgi:hypothetical protein